MSDQSTLIEVTDKTGASVILHEVDGIRYPSYSTSPISYKPRLRDIQEMKLYPEDIIVTGFPRSGNHWAYEIVHMLTNQTATFHTKVMAWHSQVDCCPQSRIEELNKMAPPKHITSHFRLSQFSPQLPELRPKLVYVMRNPKDVLVSMYNLCRDVKLAVVYDGTWEDFLQLALTGQFIYGTWFDHVLDMERFLLNHPGCPVHVLVYEKVKENPVEELTKLARYLGQSEDLVSKIAEMTSFSHMQANVLTGKESTRAGGFTVDDMYKNAAKSMCRKGDVGEWRAWFTPAQSAQVDQLFASKMAGSKLADLIRLHML